MRRILLFPVYYRSHIPAVLPQSGIIGKRTLLNAQHAWDIHTHALHTYIAHIYIAKNWKQMCGECACVEATTYFNEFLTWRRRRSSPIFTICSCGKIHFPAMPLDATNAKFKSVEALHSRFNGRQPSATRLERRVQPDSALTLQGRTHAHTKAQKECIQWQREKDKKYLKSSLTERPIDRGVVADTSV